MATAEVVEVLDRIRRRDSSRPEAQLQAEIYQLLTMGALDLGEGDVAKLEVQTGDGTRRRLDVEVGHCCIEVKKDLRVGNVLEAAKEQLAGYVQHQAETYGRRYVGILTDGATWYLYRLVNGALTEVAVLDASRADADDVLTWLESVLATEHHIPPTPSAIRERLGADSPGHQLDHATLADLYARNKDVPEVAVKKDLWSKLLRTAFGSAFDDDPDLFVDHTLLVLTAEAIAHAVVGFDLIADQLTAAEVTRGSRFREAQIYGVVEEDFFDWVLQAEGGEAFVLDLMRRVARFDWSTTMRHDVLKSLYTSVIAQETRESLGEYYTPDWLADRMVADAYTDPLNQRLLEPSAGSGTFLMHAVKAHLDAAESSGMTVGEAISSVTSHVIGMDIHPVAVALARVSYLIAIGQQRLQHETRGPVTIPVYLGDSIQWEQHIDLLAGTSDITVSTAGDDLVSGGGALFGDDLRFPLSVLDDAARFDQLVSEMADAAVDAGKDTHKPATVMKPILSRAGVTAQADRELLVLTFDTMRRLHRSGRNHIWGYYVRNLIRPLWLTRPGNQVDVLVGNPPWLRYSKMTSAMQDRYKGLAKARNLLTGGLGASARDLSTLFVARAVELYLKDGGRFAFVMPHGILTRKPHTGFRTGDWSSKTVSLAVTFESAWDLDDIDTGFPMTACVIHGTLSPTAKALSTVVTAWHGNLGTRVDRPWHAIEDLVTTTAATVADTSTAPDAALSPYRAMFRQGAILVPRYLLFVDEQTTAGPLGAGAGRTKVTSTRSTQEKPPWKHQPSLSGTVERSVIRDVYLGENIAPYRPLTPRRAVLPLATDRIMTRTEVDALPGASGWWADVESGWQAGRKLTEKLPLLDRFDYQRQLSAQLPVATHRVVYSKAGTSLAAARVTSSSAVIDHNLYWAAVGSVDEGRYLEAILNSATLLDRVRPLQAKGLFGPRHFDKYVFHVPFPTYDPAIPEHATIVQLAAQAEQVAASVDLSGVRKFTDARSKIRAAIEGAGIGKAIEDAVAKVLPVI
ncbi:N-6 DNA methylase [Luteipulveratus sp. YIM 133132]|uniref:N-6 DNA methylase n=1 Tax=Luteipulveratus flavus TaxID=3031728 RepID=UPI0023B0C170|nr:N-6 DNA methylase [Luteipulveratus sp. YIM 133132]MDE9363994.1 N-6 DNA methylase [Luteipulveratus sp. YIM 133132]